VLFRGVYPDENLFKEWLIKNFLNDFSKNNLLKISYSKKLFTGLKIVAGFQNQAKIFGMIITI
jgi:hypothetical protein